MNMNRDITLLVMVRIDNCLLCLCIPSPLCVLAVLCPSRLAASFFCPHIHQQKNVLHATTLRYFLIFLLLFHLLDSHHLLFPFSSSLTLHLLLPSPPPTTTTKWFWRSKTLPAISRRGSWWIEKKNMKKGKYLLVNLGTSVSDHQIGFNLQDVNSVPSLSPPFSQPSSLFSFT